MAVPKRNQPAGPYPHQLARWCFPVQLAVEGASLQVQASVVMTYIRASDPEWLIVHEQANDLAVRHVQHGLAGAGETVGGLAVDNRPLFIEAIDERAVLHSGVTLFRHAAHAEIPVAQRKQGLRLRDEFRVEGLFDQVPLVGWIVVVWWPQPFMMKHRIPIVCRLLLPGTPPCSAGAGVVRPD